MTHFNLPMLRWAAAGLVAAALAFFPPRVHGEEILVAAAASLTDSLKEIGRNYEGQGGGRVSFNFGGSSTLARQIAEGAPADIFFSADLEKMEYLRRQGWVEPGSQMNLLSNVLVMVVSAEAAGVVRSPKDLLRREVKRIALAEPSSVPAGIYARKYLQSVGLWNAVRDKVIPLRDVRAALAAVESGNADAGFVYRTDAAISKKLRPAYEVPTGSGPEIIYPVALIKDSGKKAAGLRFMEFLASEQAERVFQRYGFTVLR